VALFGLRCLVGFEDLVDGARELAEKGLGARDALGIGGGSAWARIFRGRRR
jgi:protease II